MKRPLVSILILIALIIIGFFALGTYTNDEVEDDNGTLPNGTDIEGSPFVDGESEGDVSSITSYFANQMFQRATENGLIPIEGFDADLLMGAYPGLVTEDFDKVTSFEGIYSVESGELVYTRTQDQPVSSAERTISNEGYATLLANVAERLSLPATTEADVDALIDALSGD